MRFPLVFLLALATTVCGKPTLPIESMSSGLAAMITGPPSVVRSAVSNISPGLGVTNIPPVQSNVLPLQQPVSNSAAIPLVTPSTPLIVSSQPPLPLVPTSTILPSAKQGLFPSQITALPGALASQMQSQMSQLQQQVTSVGGSLISQTQDQMSSLQSQMASIPSAIGSMIPSGLVPQRAPVSTVAPIVTNVTPLPVAVTSHLPIGIQGQ